MEGSEVSNPGYFAVIPASVRYHSALPPNAKLLYGEITALCNQEGYCWASNAYFAKLYNVGGTTVSEWVSALKKAGFIRIEIDQARGNERKVFIVEAIPVFRGSSSGKAEDPSSGKAEGNNTEENKTKNAGAFSLSLDDGKKEKKPRKGSGKATKEEMEAFAEEIELPKSDGFFLFLKFESDGWPKNWQAKMRQYKVGGWLPSQKGGRNGVPPDPSNPRAKFQKHL